MAHYDVSKYYFQEGKLQNEYESLYDEKVPLNGPASDSSGEMLRAISRMIYRRYNDGDDPVCTYNDFQYNFSPDDRTFFLNWFPKARSYKYQAMWLDDFLEAVILRIQ